MASSKAFLLQECHNVRDVLDETLRYKYGGEGSKDFYEECLIRLDSTKAGIEQTPDQDHDQLTAFSIQLRRLTYLIARIERSSIGEYSWPFVEELKEMAASICAEVTLTHDRTLPKIHVLSEGGLRYAIDPEQSRPSASRRKILTIVLPRTLKHFVLLHSILGHEIGHAIWAHAKHQNRLKQIRDAHLSRSGSVLETPDATAARMFDSNVPFMVRQSLMSKGAKQGDFFTRTADWDAWIEELLCDLIGLLTFGPSYVAAACHLLLAIDPTGMKYGPDHPPVAWRLNMLLDASSILGLDVVSSSHSPTDEAAQAFWSELKTKRNIDSWCDVIDRPALKDALSELSLLLNDHPPAPYPLGADTLLPGLIADLKNLVPPVGFSIADDDSLRCPTIDFRHILYAGWIQGHSNTIGQKDLNRLCEHAIMQQRALKMFTALPA
ncbi:MAG: hypothetical protein V4684_04515 [Pseudomonadota bacterium]